MKKNDVKTYWYRCFPFKAACFILCVIMLCITAASVIMAVIIAEDNLYESTREDVFENKIDYRLREDARHIVRYAFSFNLYEGQSESGTVHKNSFYDAEITNMRYMLINPAGNIIDTNISETEHDAGKDAGAYGPAYNGADKKYRFFYNIEKHVLYEVSPTGPFYGENNSEDEFIIEAYIANGLPVHDKYEIIWNWVCVEYSLKYAVYVILAVSLIASTALFTALMCMSGRRAGNENASKVYAGFASVVPIDVMCAAVIGAMAFAAEAVLDMNWSSILIFAAGMWCVFSICAVLGLSMSIAARIKNRVLFKNTLIRRLLVLLGRCVTFIIHGIRIFFKIFISFLRSVPLISVTFSVVIMLGFLVFMIPVLVKDLSFGPYDTLPILILILIYGLLICAGIYTLYAALMRQRLHKAAGELAGGNLNYKVDTKHMVWVFKKHGDNLNRISEGMSLAVGQRLKSERMKAELITNVSHDIKTPLTSIINYSVLISDEPCESERHKEYADVLARKARHLKRLLEDLVEISKASTGNIDIHLAVCDAGVLLEQASGEFEQRCREADLELSLSYPSENIKIMADSFRIWRVFENLMSNACKYSLPGSRVYLSAERQGSDVLFVFKNTSRAPLNISGDELKERFVRGDTSRSTEGSGLGLSIAESLTSLQNGKMDITIDGDLFKVTLRFAEWKG